MPQWKENASPHIRDAFAANKAQDLREKLNDKCPAPDGQVGFEFPQSVEQDIDHCMAVGIQSANSENELRQIKLDGCT